MLAEYLNGKTVINVLIGKYDLERLERQLPLASIGRLSGTGERVFIGYIEYTQSNLAEPVAEYDGRSINLLFPRHYRAQHVQERDENHILVVTPTGSLDGRVIRLNVQSRREIPL